MRDLYIIGSGGLGKEVFCVITDINNNGSPEYDFKGFIDYQSAVNEISIGNVKFPVIDEDDFLSTVLASDNICLAIGIGSPKSIQKVSRKFKDYQFPNLIHPNFIGQMEAINMGKGNVITAGNIFTCDITIGNFNYVNLACTVGHDSIIGSFNVINPGCNISGGVKIGDLNLLGTNATILQYLSIGDYNILGAGGVLTKGIENNQVFVGSPAKFLKENL